MELGVSGGPHPVADVVDALVSVLPPGAQVVLPISNGEPVEILNGLEARAGELDRVMIHQMHALRDRPYLHGAYARRLDHTAWFLSHVTRPAFQAGGCQFAPANFSEVPHRLLEKEPAVVIAAASPPDKHGYFSLGLSADYTASLIGRVPFVLEVNPQVPRTSGANRLHQREVLAWCEADYPMIEVPAAVPNDVDLAIARSIADRIPDEATLQLGIGSIPSAVAGMLTDHRDLAIHTELFSDPLVDLIESGAATGIHKKRYRSRAVTTFALGSQRLYDFVDENDAVVFLPVDEVNDPRLIGREDRFVSVNGTLQVDLFGQCASETLGTQYWSGSGGQADFARGSQYSKGGQGFVVLRSTTSDRRVSRVVPTLNPGAVVTTNKNTVDNVVTEFGIAELRGRTLRQRARALIDIAHPEHRDWLEREAASLGLLRR